MNDKLCRFRPSLHCPLIVTSTAEKIHGMLRLKRRKTLTAITAKMPRMARAFTEKFQPN